MCLSGFQYVQYVIYFPTPLKDKNLAAMSGYALLCSEFFLNKYLHYFTRVVLTVIKLVYTSKSLLKLDTLL